MARTILLLEDEPLILMDLEYAAQDQGCTALAAASIKEALAAIEDNRAEITAAVLDVSLGAGVTCFPVAQKLSALGIPFILHSGDLDRHDERIRDLGAKLIAKPASSDAVINFALACAAQSGDAQTSQAAE